MAQLTFSNVGKVYDGGVRAVSDFSLAVEPGEFVVLVGPSGCGKSTLLRMVAGLEDITSGVIRIDGRVVNDTAPKDRDIAMVFQNYALYPHMTVRKNMAFALMLRRTPRRDIERRVAEAAAVLGIGDLLDRRPRELSGGQRQRVAVGRAIVRAPKAFLFDEPLSNLDAKLRVEMRAELKRLHRQLRTTTLYVTHDQEEAMTLGDRIVVLHEGLMQQCDGPLAVYARPANRFVAGFVGTPPMNFLSGTLATRDGAVYFQQGPARLRLEGPAGALGAWMGKDVVLGVRPEGIGLHGGGRFAGPDNTLRADIVVVEPLGEKMDVLASTAGGGSLVARVDADSAVTAGTPATLYLDMRKVHVFQPGPAGQNLSLPAPRA